MERGHRRFPLPPRWSAPPPYGTQRPYWRVQLYGCRGLHSPPGAPLGHPAHLPSAKGGGRELGKADAVFPVLILVEDEGFGDLLGGKADEICAIRLLDILLGDRRDGCRVGIKDAYDVSCANILVISNVKVHKSLLRDLSRLGRLGAFGDLGILGSLDRLDVLLLIGVCRDGEVDQLLLLAKTHDDDASRASRAAGHTRNGRANDGSRIGDHHDIVLVGDGGNAREDSALLGQVVAGDAVASAVLHQAEVGKGRALAKAVLGDAEQILALVHHANACNVIALAQLDAAHAACRASHGADVALGEADGLPLCGSDHQIAFALGGNDVDQLVALVQIQSDLSASALVLVLGEQRSLDDALLCDHRQIGLLVEGVHADAGRDLLALGHLENVDDVLSLCGSARLGDQVGLAHLHFSCIGEHHEVGVAVDGHDLLNVVLLLGGHADDALAARLGKIPGGCQPVSDGQLAARKPGKLSIVGRQDGNPFPFVQHIYMPGQAYVLVEL